jgi:hypothetical protein
VIQQSPSDDGDGRYPAQSCRPSVSRFRVDHAVPAAKASDSVDYDFYTIPPAGLVTTWFSSFIGGASCGGTFARINWRTTPRRSESSEFRLLTSSGLHRRPAAHRSRGVCTRSW